MNRQQAKELLPIIQAFAEGKEIQAYNPSEKEWCDKYESIDFCSESPKYRIKTEPKYRPFKDVEECWQEMQKHQPFGWVRYKEEHSYTVYCYVSNDNNFKLDLKEYTFADGNPFGIKE